MARSEWGPLAWASDWHTECGREEGRRGGPLQPRPGGGGERRGGLSPRPGWGLPGAREKREEGEEREPRSDLNGIPVQV